MRRVDILEDTGTSINPEIDVGQVEGAFVMSLGMWLTEQLRYDPMSGKLLTCDTWVSKTVFDFKLSNFENLLKTLQEYKPPSSKDIPEDFRVRFHDSKRNSKAGVFGAKAVGEQASLMACSAVFALRRAIDSVNQDLGHNQLYYQLGNFCCKICP